jgi:cell division protein FtsB
MSRHLISRLVNVVHRVRALARRPRVWLALGAIVLCTWLLLSRYGIITRIELEHTASALDAAIAQRRRTLDSLRRYSQRLERDTVLLEQLARERHGMIRPGELVLIVTDTTR